MDLSLNETNGRFIDLHFVNWVIHIYVYFRTMWVLLLECDFICYVYGDNRTYQCPLNFLGFLDLKLIYYYYLLLSKLQSVSHLFINSLFMTHQLHNRTVCNRSYSCDVYLPSIKYNTTYLISESIVHVDFVLQRALLTCYTVNCKLYMTWLMCFRDIKRIFMNSNLY